MYREKLAVLLYVSGAFYATTDHVLASSTPDRDWVQYAEEANGDLYFYDRAQVEKADTKRLVWNGIRYKTSLMGAFSHHSLVEIDCSERTEKTIESTFFSDENWENPAMGTNMSERSKTQIKIGSTLERLFEIVCD